MSGALHQSFDESARTEAKSAARRTKRPIHTAPLVEAFSHAVLVADFRFGGDRLPEALDSVINWIAFKVQREFPDTFAVLRLEEAEAKYRERMADHPAARAWNPAPARNDVARRYCLACCNGTGAAPLAARPFIEAGSVVRNAARLTEREWADRAAVHWRLLAG